MYVVCALFKETVVELQQLEIQKLDKKVDGCMKEEHDKKAPGLSLLEVRQQEEERTQQAQTIFKRVLQKHHHQRENKTFVTPVKATEGFQPKHQDHVSVARRKSQAKGSEASELMLERRRQSSKSLDASLASKVPIVDDLVDAGKSVGGAIVDGTGLVGDALGDAYEHATDKISFVANTVIDTVEKAIDILSRGFNSFHAGCTVLPPHFSFSGGGLRIFFGAMVCSLTLMGQTTQLFHVHYSDTTLPFPEPLNTIASFATSPVRSVLTMGHELTSCHPNSRSIITCLGNKIINYVPPLSYLNRMSDILADFLEGFAKVAATIAGQVLKGSMSLIQQAVKSKFPAAGAPAVVHHSGQSLVITTHTRKRERKPEISALQMDGSDEPPKDGISFNLHNDGGNYQSKLISQLLG